MTVGEFKVWLEQNEVDDDVELYVDTDPYDEGSSLWPERELTDPIVGTVTVGILNPEPTVLNVVMFS